MKSFLVVLCSLACAYAVVQDQVASVVRSSSVSDPDGSFQYSYETDNGIVAAAEGKLKRFEKDEVALEVVGSNQYVAPNGEKYELTYIANENGYQPQGAHLPTPPPPQEIPDYIARAVKYIETHPPKEETVARRV